MTLKLSLSGLLSFIVCLFILLLFGMLVYSIKLTSNKYHDYKLRIIMNSPCESYAKITGKYAMGGGFDIEYQFKGKVYGKVMKVKKEVFKLYEIEDRIPITVSRDNPFIVSLTSELNAYKQKYQ